MRKAVITLVTLFAFHGIGLSQTVQKMIDNVTFRPIYGTYSQYATNLNSLKIKSPFLEEINLRTETDQNNLARQEFALRTIFNAWGLSKVYQKQKDLLLQKLDIDREEQMQKDMFTVYNDALKMNFLMVKDSLLARQNIFNQKKLEHLIRIIGTGADVNAKEVLRLEEDIYKSNSDRALIGESLKSYHSKYGLDKVSMTLFSIEEIERKVKILSIDASKSFENRKATLELEENSLSYDLQRKDARRVLDYAQLRYSRRDNLLFQDEFSLGLGLRLPYKGSLSVDKSSFMIEKQEIDHKLNLSQIDDLTTLAEMKRKFNSNIEKIKYFEKAQENIFGSLNSTHPNVAEEISYFKEDLKLNTEIKLISLREELWLLYLEMLQITEQISPVSKEVLGTD
jgi:hypothetical protein